MSYLSEALRCSFSSNNFTLSLLSSFFRVGLLIRSKKHLYTINMFNVSYAPTTANVQPFSYPQRLGNNDFIQYQCAMAYQHGLLMNQQQQSLSVQGQLCNDHLYAISSKPASPQKLVIFDWDDTIYPTTSWYLGKQKWTCSQLEEFGKSAYDLLTKYIATFGLENVYIVTNGEEHWIQYSLDAVIKKLKKYSVFPASWYRIKQLLSTKLVGRVISARSLFNKQYPKQTTTWKTLVFKQIAKKHFGTDTQTKCSIISIGDSLDEYTASINTQKWMKSECGFQSVHLNRFKLQRQSTREEMRAQFTFLMELDCDFEDSNGNWYSCDVQVAQCIH